MAGLQLSGLASGFDWKTVVNQLVELQRVPQNRLSKEKSSNTSKLSTYSTVQTKLENLRSAVRALSSDSLFAQRTASTSDTSLGWSASAAGGATAGEFAIDVTKLATRSVRTGVSDVAAGLNGSNDVSGVLVSELRLGTAVTAGTFTVNDAQVEIETTDTLQDVFDKIASATGGAVTASYDSGSDRITLSSADDITLGSGVDTSNFLFAARLFNNGSNAIQSTAALGTLSLNDSIAGSGLSGAITAVDGAGNGTFSINGVSIGFNVNDDSIRDVIKRVNESAAGVTMAYDATNDRFSLTNRNTGDLGISVSENGGGLLGAFGIKAGSTLTRGLNAELSVNGGGTLISASNTFDESILGVPGLSVTATRTGAQTIAVKSDTSSIEKGIRSFISAFNDVQSYLEAQTKVTVSSDGKVSAALFSGNQELTAMARELRSIAFSSVSGGSGGMARLENLGIDFEGTSAQLAVRDGGKFSQALESKLSDISALFTKDGAGISSRIDTYLGRMTQSNGLVDIQKKSLERQNRSLDVQIADIERRLEAERTRLEASFMRMEEAQSRMSSQLSALQSTLNL